MRNMYKPTFLVREEARRRLDNSRLQRTGVLKTAAGEVVFVQGNVIDRLRRENMVELVREAISRIAAPIEHDGKRSRSVFTVDMGRVIGADDCVEAPRVSLDDPTLFVLIPRHHEPVRVVTDREPAPCRTVTLVVERGGRGFQLIAAWIGRATPKQPHDLAFENPFEEAAAEIDFWSTHALVAKPDWGRPWRSTWRRVITEALETA